MHVQKLSLDKLLLIATGLAIVAIVIFSVLQLQTLRKAHSTFANYYTFRGCVQLLTKTPTYGICKTASGSTIEIVLYHGKWYLNNDLPTGLWGHLN